MRKTDDLPKQTWRPIKLKTLPLIRDTNLEPPCSLDTGESLVTLVFSSVSTVESVSMRKYMSLIFEAFRLSSLHEPERNLDDSVK